MKQPARANERELILQYLERFICFDHIEKYACEHSQCYELRRIQDGLKKGLHLA